MTLVTFTSSDDQFVAVKCTVDQANSLFIKLKRFSDAQNPQIVGGLTGKEESYVNYVSFEEMCLWIAYKTV